MIKKYILLSLLVIFSIAANAQFEEFVNGKPVKKQEQKQPRRYFYGGDFGLQLGTVTYINLSPQIGYKITKFFNAGIGATYIYYNNKFYNYSYSVYGGSVFSQIIPVKFLLIHGELQYLNTMDVTSANGGRIWDLGLLAGIGYRMQYSETGSINYMLLWNFNENPNSPFTNPIFRVNITF